MPDDLAALALGIDLGGTKILTAVTDAHGRILSRDHCATPAAKGQDAVIESLVKSGRRALEQASVAASALDAVGVAAAGPSNAETGILLTSPNLPGWQDVPLRDTVEKELRKETFLVNDANAAALAELRYGAARGARNYVYVTIGTGIGGGIVVDGEMYTGVGGTGGEVGHMSIDDSGPLCNCGSRGCWETLASGTALATEARHRIKEGARTSILNHAGGDTEKVTASVVHKAAQAGDSLANEIIARTGYYVGVGLANLVNIFNPEMIVVGGGLASMGDMLLRPAFEVAAHRAFKQAYQKVRFARAELGQNSAVVGAAAFARQEMKKRRTLSRE